VFPLLHLAVKKIADGAGNFMQVRLKCEVTRVVEMHFRARNIALEGPGPGLDEGLIVLAPNYKQRRLRSPEILLELG